MGVAAVTPFAIALQLFNVAIGPIAAIVGSVSPAFASLHALGEKEKMRSLIVRMLKLQTGFAGMITIMAIFFGHELLTQWVGAEHVAPRGVLLSLVAIFALRSLAMVFEMVVVGTLRHRSYALIVMGEGILNFALSLLLVQYFGLSGIALGTLGAHALCTGWFLPFKGMQLTGLTYLDLSRSLVHSVAPVLVITCLAALAFSAIPIASGWLRIVCGVLGTGLLFASAFWRLALDSEERGLMRRWIRNRWDTTTKYAAL